MEREKIQATEKLRKDMLYKIKETKANLLALNATIEANFDGTTYGLGTTLAGGWRGWFVAVPIVATYADMEDTNTDGIVTTVTPRAGRIYSMGRWGSLALFAGTVHPQ